MTSAPFDVLGIGNAIVDVISRSDEAFLGKHGLVKGSMMLIDEARAEQLYAGMGPGIEVSGGSCGNTMAGIASFGGKGAYIGKVRDDQLGKVFGHDLKATGVSFATPAATEGPATARCLILVTPDAQRTMNTYLGVSSLLQPSDVDEATVAAGRVLYMEGYLYDRPAAKEAFRHAARVAHAHGRQVSLTLSDSFCVDRHRADFRALVADEVDLLFGNSDELLSLYEVGTIDEGIAAVRADCELAVITMGAEGCRIITRDEIIEAPAEPVSHVLDTTGAGDLFAAGFLYGHTRDLPLHECARLGAIAAAEVISHVGPRPLVELRTLIP